MTPAITSGRTRIESPMKITIRSIADLIEASQIANCRSASRPIDPTIAATCAEKGCAATGALPPEGDIGSGGVTVSAGWGMARNPRQIKKKERQAQQEQI